MDASAATRWRHIRRYLNDNYVDRFHVQRVVALTPYLDLYFTLYSSSWNADNQGVLALLYLSSTAVQTCGPACVTGMTSIIIDTGRYPVFEHIYAAEEPLVKVAMTVYKTPRVMYTFMCDAWIDSFRNLLVHGMAEVNNHPALRLLARQGVFHGMAAKTLCATVGLLVEQGYLQPTSTVGLEADGEFRSSAAPIRDRFPLAVYYYRTYGFRPMPQAHGDLVLEQQPTLIDFINSTQGAPVPPPVVDLDSVPMYASARRIMRTCETQAGRARRAHHGAHAGHATQAV